MSSSADLLAGLTRAIADGLQGNTLTSCSRWSAKRRVMGGDFPGPYSWDNHPWVKELLDTRAGENYVMKSAQMGVTEVAINRAFYVLDQVKRDVLYVLPTALTASDFSKGRFSIALKMSPYLASLFTDTNTVNLKQAGTTNLYIRGSNSESGLVSIPVSELILDEVDRMKWEQVRLARERLAGQLRKCIWGISTPKIPNKGIHKLFLYGTQEHYVFQCPACSRWTELVWPDCMEIVGETVNDPRCDESHLKCKECKAKLHHENKMEWLKATAKWQSALENPNFDIRSFYINQLYSRTVSPGEIVRDFHAGLGDEAVTKEFFNSKLGLPFVGDGAQITDEMLEPCISPSYTTNSARPKVGGQRLITLGVDQGKTSWWTVCEWLIDGSVSRDINVSAFCKVLAYGKFLDEEWNMLDTLMREWQVLACVIDVQPETNEARRFARRFPGYVYLCRYGRGKTAKEMSFSEEETDAPVVTVDRSNWFSASLGRFRTKRISLPRDVNLQYKDHIKAMVRTYEKDEQTGEYVMVYDNVGPDHYAHSLNYAEIALPLAASITTGQNVEKFL